MTTGRRGGRDTAQEHGNGAQPGLLASAALLAMGGTVLLDVLHRSATRPQIGWLGWVAWAVLLQAANRRVSRTLLGLVATKLVLVGLVWLFPTGFVWSQTFALIAMFWVACVGAVLAARSDEHLSFDAVLALWPYAYRGHAQRVGAAVTAVFCLGLA